MARKKNSLKKDVKEVKRNKKSFNDMVCKNVCTSGFGGTPAFHVKGCPYLKD
jgi:hypothetical protein